MWFLMNVFYTLIVLLEYAFTLKLRNQAEDKLVKDGMNAEASKDINSKVNNRIHGINRKAILLYPIGYVIVITIYIVVIVWLRETEPATDTFTALH